MKILIPLSGGIDSSYLVAKALSEGHSVVPLIFDDSQGKALDPELRAAHAVCHYYQLTPLVVPFIPLDSLVVIPDAPTESQAAALATTQYWAGYKTLFYTYALSLGTAQGCDEIWWGTTTWNDHFQDEIPSNALVFRDTWASLYPDLVVPQFVFPLLNGTKLNVVRNCYKLGVPLTLTYSCLTDTTVCGQCIGCLDRAQALHEFSTELGKADPFNLETVTHERTT